MVSVDVPCFLLGGCSIVWQQNSVLVGQGTLHTTTGGTSHVLCSREGPVLVSQFVRYFCKCVLCLKRDFTVRSVHFIFQENYSYLRIFHNFITLWHLDIAFIMNTLFVFITWNSNLDSWKSRFQDFFTRYKKHILRGGVVMVAVKAGMPRQCIHCSF